MARRLHRAAGVGEFIKRASLVEIVDAISKWERIADSWKVEVDRAADPKMAETYKAGYDRAARCVALLKARLEEMA